MLKPGFTRIVLASFKRPVVAVVLFLEIVVLASPAFKLYGKAAPVDMGMLTMFLGPLYLILNSVLKDSTRHLVMRVRFSRPQLIWLINLASFVLAGVLAFTAASVYLARFRLAGCAVSVPEYLGYFCFELLFLCLMGTIHNFLCEILNSRLIAFFMVFLPVMYEYFSAAFPDAWRFTLVYQSVLNIFRHTDFSFYLYLWVFGELILFLSTFVSREVIDR